MIGKAMRAGAAALALSVLAIGPAAAADQDITVGVVAALTGPFAAGSRDSIDGLNVWIKNHGIPGHKIVLNVGDDETNPVNAQGVFRRLASDPKVQLVLMFSNSNAGMAIKPFASEFKVPIISGGGSDTLGMPPDPWLFKVVPNTLEYMKVLCAYAQKMGYKRLAHIRGTDDYGQLDSKNLNAVAAGYGLTLVDQESVAIDATNFSAEMIKIAAAKPDLIYSSLGGRAGILLFKALQQTGNKVPVAVTTSAISQAFFDAIGGADKAAGLLSPTQIGTLGEKVGGTTAAYYSELAKGLGKTPAYFNTFGFDAGLILGAGVTGSDGSRAGIRAAIEKVSNLPALNGYVTFTPENHAGQDARALIMGKLTATGAFDPAITP